MDRVGVFSMAGYEHAVQENGLAAMATKSFLPLFRFSVQFCHFVLLADRWTENYFCTNNTVRSVRP
jgi:hypothetical protein